MTNNAVIKKMKVLKTYFISFMDVATSDGLLVIDGYRF